MGISQYSFLVTHHLCLYITYKFLCYKIMHVLLEICHILFAFYTIELKVSTIFASFKMDFVQMSLTD